MPDFPEYPFWSAIITQTRGSGSITAGSTVIVDIQPATGETWWIEWHGQTAKETGTYTSKILLCKYDGSTEEQFDERYTSSALSWMDGIGLILTNTNYLRTKFFCSYADSYYYNYSGFKLSQPLWSPKRTNTLQPKVWKRPTASSLPSAIRALRSYACDILGLDPARPDEYTIGVILEEDTVLAVDPETNFPVERLTVVVKADVLADFIVNFKAGTDDPLVTGYRKYLDRWKAEGIDLGV